MSLRLRLRKNDQVVVIAGRDRGKRGKVLRIFPERNRAIVERISMIKRHTRPNPSQNIKGGLVEREGSIEVSNLMVVCGECDRPTRPRRKWLNDGRKVRICHHCEGVIDK
uniref:Large ribosomal subunit protein uL24 n=2 Tax=environmental samples TaxID=57727 RepID=A0A0H4TN51_9BACT|nr:50S ribosomal protein L24, large subunit ribosomal protein L24 [uncultured Acidobacteria bacterium Rifle_16ft_4_minimus_33611]AKQ03774.1 50S ribosomal protein L24, large subunit ribosomal protein L24 [uncultured Acidobacteria bacterium Rifle_16ft_4_minimus_38548]